MPTQGSMLPPDVRAEMTRSGQRGGIGSRAHENEAAARAREAAMNPDATPEPDQPVAKAEEAKEPDLVICPAKQCRKPLEKAWRHCAHCGFDLMRDGAAKKLGITFTEEDVHDYIFRGFAVRELTILGKHKITVKSTQPTDIAAIDNYIMNGDWSKNKDGSQKNIGDFYLRQVNALAVTASGLLKIDGASIGESLEERMKYLLDRGTAFVDLLSGRVILFNKALTEHLDKVDVFLGS